MSAIDLGGGYALRHDGSRNWILSLSVIREKVTSRTDRTKTGETYESEEIIGYYSSLENAADRLAEKHLEGVVVSDIKALVREVREYKAAVISRVQQLQETA